MFNMHVETNTSTFGKCYRKQKHCTKTHAELDDCVRSLLKSTFSYSFVKPLYWICVPHVRYVAVCTHANSSAHSNCKNNLFGHTPFFLFSKFICWMAYRYSADQASAVRSKNRNMGLILVLFF